MTDFRSALEPELPPPTEFPDEMPPLQRIGHSVLGGLMERLAFAAEISKRTESPIETMMGVALHEVFCGIDAQIIPQYRFGRLRIDWAVQLGNRLAFVECDGAEFHSKPEDVARDRAKDAAVAESGIKMFRFTGAAIYKDQDACAWSVRDWLLS